MSPDESGKKLEELNEKLAQGRMSEEEYWDEIQLLDQRSKGYNYQYETDLFRSIKRAGLQIVLLILPLAVGLFLIYLLFFYHPPHPDISIKVGGAGIFPATSKEKTEIYRGLELIKEYSLEDYIFVDEYVDKIEVAAPAGISFFGKIRGYYRGGPTGFGKTIRIVRDFKCPIHCTEGDWSGSDLLTAEFIIHEACHSMQHHMGLEFSETQCYELQFQFAEEVGPKLWRDFNREYFIYSPSEGKLNV